MGNHLGGEDRRGRSQTASNKIASDWENAERKVETDSYDGGYTWVIRYQASI